MYAFLDLLTTCPDARDIKRSGLSGWCCTVYTVVIEAHTLHCIALFQASG